MRTTKFRRLAAIGLVTTISLTAAACGGDDDESATGTTSAPSAMPSGAGAADPFGAACSTVPSSGAGSFAGMAADPVATAASNNPALSTLVSAVQDANLVDTLNSAKDITVFAPVNDAFGKLPKATLDAAMADPSGLLTQVLTYHVVGQRITPEQLEKGSFETLEGATLTTKGSGDDFMINGAANVVCGNVQTANATVYLIDSVLSPQAASTGGMTSATQPFGPACSTVPAAGAGSFAGMAMDPVATAASNNPALSSLVSAVSAAGLVDTLNSAQDITVFAPVNDAFSMVPKSTMDAAMADTSGLLTKVLTGHVVPGRITPDELAKGSFTTLSGTTVMTSGSGSSYKVGAANVVCGNVQTANATVYLIDGVLLPS